MAGIHFVDILLTAVVKQPVPFLLSVEKEKALGLSEESTDGEALSSTAVFFLYLRWYDRGSI